MDWMDLLLIPTLAYRSNTKVLVHDSLSRRLDDFDLHIELWEISNATSGRAVQLSELEFELWAAGELVVEFQGGEQLRAAVPRVLENTLMSNRDDKWRELRTLKLANIFCDCASALEWIVIVVARRM